MKIIIKFLKNKKLFIFIFLVIALLGISIWQINNSYTSKKNSDKFKSEMISKQLQDLEKENQELKSLVDKIEREKKDLENKVSATNKNSIVIDNDPFPTNSNCPEDKGTYESYQAHTECQRQYLRNKEAWYARHGQTMPQPTQTQNNSAAEAIRDQTRCLSTGIGCY